MNDHEPLERELKLKPRDPVLLEQLARVERLGELVVKSRSRELQRNSFFDTPARALSAARLGFRRRTIASVPGMATWSLKAGGKHELGVATRAEIELQLDADTPPAVALAALGQAARQRNAPLVADQLADALAGGGLPLAEPFVETETDRVIVNLVAEQRGWSIELALDRVRLPGHDYSESEIEAELKQGDEAAFQSVREGIEVLGNVSNSDGSKLSRAMAHLKDCRCASQETRLGSDQGFSAP